MYKTNFSLGLMLPERLGDALFCTPAIAFIRKHLPQAFLVALCTSPLSTEVAGHNPHVNAVIAVPIKALNQAAKQHAFDLIISLHHDITGIFNQELKSQKIQVVLSPNVSSSGDHCAIKVLRFASAWLGKPLLEEDFIPYPINPQPEHFEQVHQLLQAEGVLFSDKKPMLIAYHVGCHRFSKNGKLNNRNMWPLQNYITLSKLLLKAYPSMRFVLTGSKNEQLLSIPFKEEKLPIIDLINKTSLHTLTALIDKYVSIVISGDTGVQHVAAATSVNLISLFGEADPVQTGPYPQRAHHFILKEKVLSDLDPTIVKSAIDKFIAAAAIT